ERLLARGELSFRRPDLPLRQSVAARTAQTRTRQAAPAGALGNDSRTQFHLCALQPADQKKRPERDLYLRPRHRRAGDGGEDTAGRGWWRTLVWRGLTPSSIPTFSKMKKA